MGDLISVASRNGVAPDSYGKRCFGTLAQLFKAAGFLRVVGAPHVAAPVEPLEVLGAGVNGKTTAVSAPSSWNSSVFWRCRIAWVLSDRAQSSGVSP
jgi:hypothetical protein